MPMKPAVPKNRANGFVFDQADAASLQDAALRAAELYRNRAEWSRLQKRAMAQDFSWDTARREYVKLYRE